MTLFFTVVIAGMAVAFTSELLGFALSLWVDPKTISRIVAIPLAAIFLWLLGTSSLLLFLVMSPASAFFSLAIMLIINRPVQLQQVINRRNY